MTGLYGLDAQFAALARAFGTNDQGKPPHHAWLFAGPRGIGKASLARIAARHLLASQPHDWTDERALAGDQGAHLVDTSAHPDFMWVDRQTNEKTGTLARNITVEQVRSIKSRFATSTALGGNRLVVIDAIDDLERGAANALLKSLEEPPANTFFFLISHAPGKLLPTIRSRCRTLAFPPLGDDVMAAAIRHYRPELSEEAIAALLAASGGSIATALNVAALDLTVMDADLDRIASGADPSNAVRSALAQALSLKAAAPRYEAFLQRAPSFIARHARQQSGPALARAVDAWSRAQRLSATAVPQSLPADLVVFEMCSYLAALAE